MPGDQSAARLLTERLADCVGLQTLVGQAKLDPNELSSRGFREGLNEIEADLGDYIGLLEARAVQLDGGLRLIGAEPEPRVEVGASLPGAVVAFTRRARGSVEEMDRLGDVESAGILAELARVADTWLWWLEVPPPVEGAGAPLSTRELPGGQHRR